MAYATVEKRNAYNKRYYLKTREAQLRKQAGRTIPDVDEREYRNLTAILGRHRLTLDKYHSLLEKQDFGCGVCGADLFDNTNPRAIHIDHDHATGDCTRGKVRGLLCVKCNVGLGCLDDGRLFAAAERYLSRATTNRHVPSGRNTW